MGLVILLLCLRKKKAVQFERAATEETIERIKFEERKEARQRQFDGSDLPIVGDKKAIASAEDIMRAIGLQRSRTTEIEDWEYAFIKDLELKMVCIEEEGSAFREWEKIEKAKSMTQRTY